MINAVLSFAALAFGSTPSGFDYELWRQVLHEHVHPGAIMGVPINVVSYPTIKRDPKFQKVVESLSKVDISDLSKNESFALGCNAYNIFAIKLITDKACRRDANNKCLGPIYGIPDLDDVPGGGFTDVRNNFGGKNYSINQIEAMFHPKPMAPLFAKPTKLDLRAHACMVCDGVSCPDLWFYDPEHIEEQLNFAAKFWMANPAKGMRIDKANNTVYFTTIMSPLWYGSEFDSQGGIEVAYKDHFPPAAKEFFAAKNGVFNTEYLGYIWDANGPVPCGCLPEVDDAAAFLPRHLQVRPGIAGSPSCHMNQGSAWKRSGLPPSKYQG